MVKLGGKNKMHPIQFPGSVEIKKRLNEEIIKHAGHLIGKQNNENTAIELRECLNSWLIDFLYKEHYDSERHKIKLSVESEDDQLSIKPLNLFTAILLMGMELPPYYLEEKDEHWESEYGKYTFYPGTQECVFEFKETIEK